ncbi:MAG TPA: hypothetical protein VFK19_10830 [Sphingomicrobium sp.]|nr:hypothetical protein [Sphingomicrobium sp.]
MSVTRKLLNFLIVIVLTAFVCGIIVALPPYYPLALKYPDVAFGVFFAGWLVSLPIVAVGGLVVGMPIALAMNSMKVGGFIKWAVAGGIAGALYSLLVLTALDGIPPSGSDALIGAWLGVAPGIAAALYWWGMIARREQREGVPV